MRLLETHNWFFLVFKSIINKEKVDDIHNRYIIDALYCGTIALYNQYKYFTHNMKMRHMCNCINNIFHWFIMKSNKISRKKDNAGYLQSGVLYN